MLYNIYRCLRICAKSSTFAPFLQNLKIGIKNMKNLTFLRFCLCAVMFTLFSTSIAWGASCDDWLTDATPGNPYHYKYRVLCPMNIPAGYVENVQQPWGTKPGIYFANIGFVSYCSLGAGNYSQNGGTGLLLHLDAFENQYTEVTITVGGVNYTFTVEYRDGTIPLDCEPGDKKIFFVNKSWEGVTPYAYMWNSSTSAQNAAWVGESMKYVTDAIGIYAYSYTGDFNKIIFNNGSGGTGNQTADLDVTECNFYDFSTEDAEVGNIARKLYFVSNGGAASWTPYVHAWWGSFVPADIPLKDINLRNTENSKIYSVVSAPKFSIIFKDKDTWTGQSATIILEDNANEDVKISGDVDSYKWSESFSVFNYDDNKWYETRDIYLTGTMNSWTDSQVGYKFSDWTESSSTVTLKVNLAASTTYDFNVVSGAKRRHWRGNDGTGATITRANSSTALKLNSHATTHGQDAHITTDLAGVYTFTYDVTTATVKVTYPAVPADAPTYPSVDDACKIQGIWGTDYTNKGWTWGQWDGACAQTSHTVAGHTMWHVVSQAGSPAANDWFGLEYGTITTDVIDASKYDKFHIDVWSATATTVRIQLINGAGLNFGQKTVNLTANAWNGIEITSLEGATTTYQIKFDQLNDADLWIADAYFLRSVCLNCEPTENIAAGKSAVAGYTEGANNASYACDGVLDGNRWASNGASLAQCWWYVDLAASYTLDRTEIFWEGAYSNDFDIQVANSNPGIEGSWTTIKNVTGAQTIGNAPGNVNTYTTRGVGRYVRIKSNANATGYGISMYEVRIYGCPNEVTIIDQANNPTQVTASSITLDVSGHVEDTEGNTLGTAITSYQVKDLDADVTNTYSVAAGKITITGLDLCTAYRFEVKAISASEMISDNSILVNYTTSPSSTFNLALNKTCYAGHETGNPTEVKEKANDGNISTYWTSWGGTANTDDWWYVDLGHIFSLSEIDLYWFYNSADVEENRRLGSEDYIIQVRQTAPVGAQITDEDEWTTVAHETNPKCGQTENTDKNAYSVDIDARYVRVQSKQRNHLGQQIRLNEMLVYGTGCGTLDDNAPIVTASLYSVGVGQATLNVAATDAEDGSIYDFYITNSITGVTTVYTDDNHDGKVTITGLENCTTYSFTVKAKDKAVNWSNNVVINSVTPVNGSAVNIAVNATTTAGYTEGGVAANTALAVDGDLATQWQSTGATAGTNEWYKVDLGQMYDLNEVKVRWGLVAGNDDGGDYPVDYKFQVSSDNTNWASFAHFNYKASTGAYQIISTSSDPLPARYVRIWVDAHDTYAMGIRELEVYSKDGCYEADGKPVITLAEVANVNPTSADIHCESWAEGKTHAELRYYYEIYENGAAIPVATGTKTHTSGNFTFTELDKGSSYSVKIWAEIISSGVRSDNYKVINFSATYSSLHYLTEETACNWTDGLYKSAWQFKYTERYSPTEEDENGDPLMILEYIDHTIINDVATTPPTIQYKLYEAGYGGIWTTGANLFFRNPKDKALKMYALGTDKFVCNLDELYVSGEAVGGWWTTSNAPTSATAVDYRMRYDAETGLFSWTGDVVPGADKHFKIVIRDIRAVDAASDTWAYNRIMDTNKDYDRDWTRATLYFDMSTWTWWWEKAMDGGCVRKGGPGTVNPDNAGTPFTDGYIIDAYVINEGGNDYFIVEAESYDADAQDNGILHIYKSENNAAVTEVYKEGGAAKTYTVGTTTYKYYRFKKLVSEISEAVNGIIRYYVKFEGPGGIIRNTEYHYFDLVHNECVPDRWVIYHHDQAPEVGDIETFAGGVIVPPIEYRRKFELDTWYTLYLPFDVTAVQVIDGDDYYDLKPYYRMDDGTLKSKNYIIRKATPATNMPVEDVENKLTSVSSNGWFDPTKTEYSTFLPQKNTPYLIQFHNAYYADKWIAFKGTRYSNIDTEFATQTAPAADEMLNIYGNNTMKNRSISSQCYQLNYEEYGGSAWTRFDNITLYPFECYILANSTTTAKYRILRRGAGEDDTTTDLEDVYEENGTVYVYTMAGQLLYTFNNVTPDEAGQQLQNRLTEGVYILRTVKNSYKLIIGGR